METKGENGQMDEIQFNKAIKSEPRYTYYFKGYVTCQTTR